MSFIGVLEQDATDVETAVVGGLKTRTGAYCIPFCIFPTSSLAN